MMVLKHRDRELLRFEWIAPQGVRIVSVNKSERKFLPLDMKGEFSEERLWSWLRRRIVPKNRYYIEAMLGRLGIAQKDTRSIIELCKGLSLNDVHWVVPEGFNGLWRDSNLYDNEFSPTLALMAFTGIGKTGLGDAASTSPEFTTNGMLAKCWRRRGGVPCLYKSGTEGAANLGFEPYSEFYASQIAAALDLPHVTYGLEKFKGRLCSTCPVFTSDKFGFIPAGALLSKEEALADPRFRNIFLFDALIFNTDRHLGNFGFLVDNDTNEIAGIAPLFDNGNGLFSLALDRPGSRYDDFSDLRQFTCRISPALYDGWLSFPGGVTAEMKARIARLKGFRFTRHKYYNLSAARLRRIEAFLQNRIEEILEFGTDANRFLTPH